MRLYLFPGERPVLPPEAEICPKTCRRKAQLLREGVRGKKRMHTTSETPSGLSRLCNMFLERQYHIIDHPKLIFGWTRQTQKILLPMHLSWDKVIEASEHSFKGRKR